MCKSAGVQISKCLKHKACTKKQRTYSAYQSAHLHICKLFCGQGWIRTTELVRGQIYSLLPLATWLLALINETPNLKITNSLFTFPNRNLEFFLWNFPPEPLVGIEPTTY
jgi:hypothetical protein